MRTLLVLCIALLAFSACAPLEDIELKAVENIQVVEMSDSKLVLDVGLRLKNPNSIAVRVKNADLLISLNGTQMGSTQLDKAFRIPSKSEETQQMRLVVNPNKNFGTMLPGLLMSALSQKITVGIDGYIKGGTMFYSKKIDVHHKEKVDMQKLNLNGLF
jgi:LEA14-like dessication related protein